MSDIGTHIFKFGLNGHIQCLTARYDTCEVDGDSCVNNPVVIFVEQMLLVQEIQFWRRIIVRTGIWNFQKFIWEILMTVKGSFC